MAWIWRVVAAACLLVAVGGLKPVVPYERASSDSEVYTQVARNVAEGDGYLADSGERPRYPPGFSIALAPFAAMGEWPDNVRAFPPLAGATLLVLLWWAAWSLGGPAAAAVAALLAARSPMIADSTGQVLSDLPATVLMCGALIAVIHRREFLAGVLIGLSAWTRLANVAFASTTQFWKGWAGALVALVPLALVQLWLFGSLSGYSPDHAEFGLRWLWERPIHGSTEPAPYLNVEFYPAVLFGRFGFLVPGLPVLAGIELWLRRSERASRFAVMVIGLNLGLYLVYFYQAQRFLLPTAVMLVVFSGALVGRLAGQRGSSDDGSERLADDGGSRPQVDDAHVGLVVGVGVGESERR